MKYTIITENDTSQWNDETGAYYHYPSKYQKILQPGAKVIYYKGKMKDKKLAKRKEREKNNKIKLENRRVEQREIRKQKAFQRMVEESQMIPLVPIIKVVNPETNEIEYKRDESCLERKIEKNNRIIEYLESLKEDNSND